MAFKFEIIDTALVVTNTLTSETVLDIPKRDCYYYSPILLSKSIIKIIDTNAASAKGAARFGCPLADARDENGVSFTESSFVFWARKNLAEDPSVVSIAGQSGLNNSIFNLQNTSGTFGAGERIYTILLEKGTVTIDGESFKATRNRSYVFKFGSDNNNTQSGIYYDATGDPAAIIYGSIG